MDTITVQLDNLVNKLPETHFIVAKDDYQKLQKIAAQGQYMTLNEVLELYFPFLALGYLKTSSIELIFVKKSILK